MQVFSVGRRGAGNLRFPSREARDHLQTITVQCDPRGRGVISDIPTPCLSRVC
ncbi:hypothetical protein BDR07DRAFT_1422587 [Suillus spraguei]|nr:hypothetical protein BDR07DRAFT_1422587 [Suillus spraguei]